MEHIKSFANTTSMKGIRWILIAESRFLRILWTTAVVVFFGTAFAQFVRLTAEFVNFESATRLEEVRFLKNNQTISFTICNLNPFSSNTSNHPENVPTYAEYLQSVESYTDCQGNCNETTTLRENLQHLPGYFQHIGYNAAVQIGHSIDTSVLQCQIILEDGILGKRKECAEFGKFSLYTNPKYLNCLVFKSDLSNLSEEDFPIGLSFLIYLDNAENLDSKNSNEMLEEKGLEIYFHHHSILPNLFVEGLKVTSGQFSVIHVHSVLRQRLPWPYGDCIPNDLLRKYSFNDEILQYSTFTCENVCLQNKVMQECNCTDGHLTQIGLPSNTPHWIRSDFCEKMLPNISLTIQRATCATSVRSKEMLQCRYNCPWPCLERFWQTTLSHSTWPLNPLTSSFYKKYIQNTFLSAAFPTDEVWIQNENSASLQVVNNMVKFDVISYDSVNFHLRDLPKLMWESFLAQLGGALNLWSGITTFVLIELIALVYKIIVAKIKHPVSNVNQEKVSKQGIKT